MVERELQPFCPSKRHTLQSGQGDEFSSIEVVRITAYFSPRLNRFFAQETLLDSGRAD